jgi:hypothetical protein
MRGVGPARPATRAFRVQKGKKRKSEVRRSSEVMAALLVRLLACICPSLAAAVLAKVIAAVASSLHTHGPCMLIGRAGQTCATNHVAALDGMPALSLLSNGRPPTFSLHDVVLVSTISVTTYQTADKVTVR